MGNSPSKKLKQPFQKHLKDTNVLEKNSTTSTIAVLKKHNPSMFISNNNTEMNMSSFTALHRTTSLPPSPTSTLPQSIKNDYIFHGRKYQSYNTKYILPNDEIEQDRLVQVHFIYKFLFGGNFSSPVRDLLSLKQLKRNSASSSSNAQQWDLQPLPQPKVLDIACGTGTWILEMATEFPETQFYGIDIAPIYPTTIKPSNTFFSQHDILNGLPFPNEYFDYIHMRHVYTCFSEEDWTTVMNEIKRLLKPGGYIELREIYPLLYQMGPITHDFFKHFICGMKNLHNVDIAWAKKMFTVLQEIGEFADIHRQIRQLYFDLPGTIGNMARNSLRTACESYRPFFEQVNNIPNDEYDRILDAMAQEIIQHHSFFDYYACWGRKTLCATEYHHQDVVESMLHATRRYSVVPSTKSASSSSQSRKRTHSDTMVSPNEKPSVLSITTIDPENHEETKGSVIQWDEDTIELGPENLNDISQFADGYDD